MLLDILHPLYVIGSIQPTDRISTNNKTGIFVDRGGWQWLKRWIYKESRIKNVMDIEKIFIAAIEEVDKLEKLIAETSRIPGAALRNRYKAEHTRLIRAIRKARKGLGNLKITYAGDSHLVARISVLSGSIDDRLSVSAASVASPFPLSQSLSSSSLSTDLEISETEPLG